VTRPALAYAEVEPADRAAWRAWLAQHHRQSTPVWVVLRKGDSKLTAEAATEEALCFGWIDSLPRKLDEARWKLLLSPRRRGSPWSAKNKATVARLEAAGLMAPAGHAAIAAAKADGSWTAYDAAERLEEPPDLRAALDAAPDAALRWARFAPSSRKGILWWLATARTATTRRKRVEQIVRLAGLGLRANFPESRGR
jgi:uncharacterized protein YdeI (YjbR/CyaY-like superfamily)